MVFYIYLGTVVFSLSTSLLSNIVFSKKLKKEGYKDLTPESSLRGNLATMLLSLLVSCTPIYNVLFAYLIIFNYDTLYEELKNDLIKENCIIKIDDSNMEIDSLNTINDDLNKINKDNNNNLENNNDLNYQKQILNNEVNDKPKIKVLTKKIN